MELGSATNEGQREKIDVPSMPPRVIMDLSIKCNLRCPMCLVWGSDDEEAIESVRGSMDAKNARRLLDELSSTKPLIHPYLWGEPLLAPHFKEIVAAAKEKGMTVALNTNGLALSDRIIEFLLDIKLDSITFSIDAATPETLKVVRGIDKLAKIENAVQRMLDARGDAELPRIGVSFTTQDENLHEQKDFIDKWTKIVDVVRIGHIFKDGKFEGFSAPGERKPCPLLYKTMLVHNDGTVSLCCLDSFRATNVGNVFEEGVQNVWLGDKLQEVRRLHETGQWDEIPICKNCNGWVKYVYEEEVTEDLLIRRSPEFTYYNRLERMDNWSGTLLGGHREDSADA